MKYIEAVARRALGACPSPLFSSLLAAMVLTAGLAGPAQGATDGVRISEFLADNAGGLRDADGDSPGWIEIHNDTISPVNLGGWHLTDSPTNLTRWTFPAVTLPAGAYLVVFASGKDRAVAGRELHTNFQLNNAGEYLALIQPDGVTIAQQFSPAYPPQRANVSFGAERQVNVTPLISAHAGARVLVPTDGLLGLDWIAPAFIDSAWLAGPTGVGFERNSSPEPGVGGTVVLALDFNDDDSGEAGTANTEAGFATMTLGVNPATINGITVSLSPLDGATLDDRDRAVPTSTATLTQDQLYDDFIFAAGQTNGNGLRVRLTGLAPNQSYAVQIWSYDNSSPGARVSDWRETAGTITNNLILGYTFDGSIIPTADGQSTFTASVRSSPQGVLQIDGRRSGGTSHGVFLNALRLVQLGFSGLIATDTGAAMSNQNATAYVRVPFTVNDPSSLQTLALRLKYDDGFVAYLNGQKIAERNAPAAPQWNSSATASHPNADALVYEEILLPNTPGLLAVGQNVLAIHGLNVSATDEDFLILPELEGLTVNENAGLYLKPVTPGAVNGPGYPGFVEDTRFSVDRGFFDTPFTVAITTATAGAQIRWTTNGTAPTETSGNLYIGPLTITNTTLLRAFAFLPGLIPTDVDTHTYLFLNQVVRQAATQPGFPTIWQGSYPADYGMDPTVVNHPQYGATLKQDLRSIPTLSLVMDHNSLWGATTGIYNNATSIGPQWERPVSAELIESDGATAFAVNCGVNMHGNASRDNARTPKHSFRLRFQSDYGPTKLDHPWFGRGVERFDNIILRAAGFVDGWPSRYSDTSLIPNGGGLIGLRYRPETSTYLRDVWVKATHGDMGWTASRSTWVHLYINGLYWGLYNPGERLDAGFMAAHAGGVEADWDVLVGGDNAPNPAEVADGSKNDWNAMMNVVNAGISSQAAYQAVENLVDLDSLIDYMMLHIFIESEDWPHHNYYAAHRRANSTNGTPATKWVFLTWDQELSLDRLVRRDRLNVSNVDTPARIYSQLRAWPEFRVRFGDRVHKHLFNDGALTPSNNVARFAALAQIITNAIVGESARWGDAREFAIGANPGTGKTFTRDEWWVPELDKLFTNFFQNLTAENVARFRAGGLYPTLNAPVFSSFGGAVPAGFSLQISNPNPAGVIYYTTDGSDPRTPHVGSISPGAQAYAEPVLVIGPTMVRARVFNAGQWSARAEAVFYPPQDLSQLTLTEVMFNPPEGDELEFLELKNLGTNSLNLSGLEFTTGLTFTFSNGTVLGPGQFFVAARNATAFGAKYQGAPLHGLFTGRLDNGGERLTLSHPLGPTVLSVTYDDVAPWPVPADGHGFSMVPRNPAISQAPDSGIEWRSSAVPGGSPGADDPDPGIPAIVINEVLSASVSPELDQIELFNPSAQAVDVSGWFLTDNHSAPRTYPLPNGSVIPAQGFLTIDERQFNASPGQASSFSLSSRGESVYLLSADVSGALTGYSHGFTFEAAEPGVTFGRYLNSVGEEQFPAQIATTFNSTNSGPRVGPIVIREIHYHPPAGDEEFVELANVSESAVPLFDPMFPANTWRLNGLGFTLPTNLTLNPGAALLLVATNPASFRAKYLVPDDVIIVGPFAV